MLMKLKPALQFILSCELHCLWGMDYTSSASAVLIGYLSRGVYKCNQRNIFAVPHLLEGVYFRINMNIIFFKILSIILSLMLPRFIVSELFIEVRAILIHKGENYKNTSNWRHNIWRHWNLSSDLCSDFTKNMTSNGLEVLKMAHESSGWGTKWEAIMFHNFFCMKSRLK